MVPGSSPGGPTTEETGTAELSLALSRARFSFFSVQTVVPRYSLCFYDLAHEKQIRE
jgi:hypothetical protein